MNASVAGLQACHGGGAGGVDARIRGRFSGFPAMIELNPVRARIADLTGRLDALRGYL